MKKVWETSLKGTNIYNGKGFRVAQKSTETRKA